MTPDAVAAEFGEGRVRWRWMGAMMAASAVAVAVIVALTAHGVLAAQFAISGLPFTVTANSLQGTGFEQFGFLDNTTPNSPNAGSTGGQQIVIVSAIGNAKLSNICQSVQVGVGFLKITAGSPGNPVAATTLVTDSTSLTGDAAFSNISIGQDASTLTEVPGVTGPEGDFAQQADSVTINHLNQQNFATTAASFTLPGLSLSFSDTGC